MLIGLVYTRAMQETTFDKERSLAEEGWSFVVGVDEAGRGPLAGPVVACATTVRNSKYLIPNFKWSTEEEKMWGLIRDSKTLSEKQREKMYDFIHEYFYVGVGIVSAETIDRVNILQATFLAMRSAVSELRRIMNHEARSMKENEMYLLVDGNQIIPNISVKQEAVIGGDGSVKSTADWHRFQRSWRAQ